MTRAEDGSPEPPREVESPRAALGGAGRIVVKIGTNVLCRDDGEIALGRIYSLIEELADIHRLGREVIVVSSGSIALGLERLGLESRPESLAGKQACAAIGQIRLMTLYQQAFERLGVTTAQILLTEGDFSDRTRYLSLRNTFRRLLELRVIPIVNENDTVSTVEIETRLDDPAAGDTSSEAPPAAPVFGDNDVLSALVASKLGADLLVILSDVDGLHDVPPERRADARRISLVDALTPEIESLAGTGSKRGRGGMRTKLRAAKIATHSGAKALIVRGSRPGVLKSALAGEDVGTLFLPKKALSSRKRWIAYASTVTGRVAVNEGAKEALTRRRASLLFAGVVRLQNDFSSGDIVSILDERGEEFARGIVNYSSGDARKLAGRRTEDIVELWRQEGRTGPGAAEFIHRDNIVILRE